MLVSSKCSNDALPAILLRVFFPPRLNMNIENETGGMETDKAAFGAILKKGFSWITHGLTCSRVQNILALINKKT